MGIFPNSRGKGLRRGTGLRRSAPIKQYGRVSQERADRKKQWEKDHPPLLTSKGYPYYYCHICLYFGEPKYVAYVRYNQYVLEHIVPKGRLSLEESQEDANLGPAHRFCNNVKGSRELCEMKHSPMTKRPNPHL